jgi:hypothetical protein
MSDLPELPSGEEMTVIYWASIVITVAVGIGCFYFAARADEQETVIALRVVGTLSLIVAGLIVLVSKIVAVFLD